MTHDGPGLVSGSSPTEAPSDDASRFIPGQDDGPTVVARTPVFTRGDRGAYALLSVFLSPALAYFLAGWFLDPDWRRSPVVIACLTLPMLGLLAIRCARWLILPVMKRPFPIRPRAGLRVGVATSFVPGIEPLDMLEETVRALVAMDYPHDTYVLDEGDDDRVKVLCLRLGARHFSRKTLAHFRASDGPFQVGCKHGNYNAWLYDVGFDRYDIVAGFDPDHVPDRDFLRSVLGFFRDPAVGYVQSPQAYANAEASPIARGAAEESYAFYSCDEPAGDAVGYPIIIGCHNTHRVSALKQVGGYAPHFADDVLLGMLYRRRGWEGVYVPRVLARGWAPEDWGTYVRQQRRWAGSLLDLKLRVYPALLKGMPAKARILGQLHGLGFLKEGIFGAMAVIAAVASLIGGACLEATCRLLLTRGLILLAILIACEIFMRRFYLEPAWRRGLQWRGLAVRFAKWPFFLMALADALTRRPSSYVPTPKFRSGRPSRPQLWPHALTVLAILGAWAAGSALGRHSCPPVLMGALGLAGCSAGLLLHERFGKR